MTKRTLTKKEAAWVRELQKVLSECPSARLGFYTIGDPRVSIYDKRLDEKIDKLLSKNDFCSAAEKCGANLGSIDFPSAVHSTAG
jgi:hypothetical protein